MFVAVISFKFCDVTSSYVLSDRDAVTAAIRINVVLRAITRRFLTEVYPVNCCRIWRQRWWCCTVLESLLHRPDLEAECCDKRVCVCVCACACVCVFVCPRSYLRNCTSDLHQIFLWMLPVAVARSSSGGVVIRCVLPVLWMTSQLLISQCCSTSPSS